jgi:hypothetical protein
MSDVIDLEAKEQPCDSISPEDIIQIGVKFEGLNGGGRVNVPIKYDYLNMPTLGHYHKHL